MSIPSVNFNNRNIRTRRAAQSHGEPTAPISQPSRTRRTRFNSPQRRRGSSSAFIAGDGSESSDTESSGNVKTILTRNKTPDFIDVPTSDSSSSDSEDAEPAGQNANWGASPPREKPSNTEIQPKIEEEHPPAHSGRKRVKRIRKVVAPAEEQEEPEPKPVQPPSKPPPKLNLPPESESENESEDGAAEIKVTRKYKTSSSSNSQQQVVPPQPVPSTTPIYNASPPPSGVSDYIIIRTKKFGGPKFQMIQNDKNILVSEMSSDKIGKFHMICLKPNFEKVLPNYQGFLREHENKNRFTLVSNVEKPNDDRDGEIMGVFLEGKSKQRTIHIITPKDGQPFFPISKRLNLSRQAKENVENILPNFQVYTKTQLETDDFDSDVVTKSVKNFKLVDEQGNLMYQIYKVANGQFNVKVAKPFNTLLAFGLSISIIVSK